MVRALAVTACAAYPFLNHLAATRAEPRWAALGLALVLWVFSAGSHWMVRSATFAAALAAAWALAAWASAVLLYVPPVAINLALAVFFGATLRPRHEPLVSRFARMTRGRRLPEELARYTRCLTVAWTAFFLLMAAISIQLAVFASVDAWSLFTNVLNYLLVALFFVLEYVYRRLRYRHHAHLSPREMVRRLRDYKALVRSDPQS